MLLLQLLCTLLFSMNFIAPDLAHSQFTPRTHWRQLPIKGRGLFHAYDVQIRKTTLQSCRQSSTLNTGYLIRTRLGTQPVHTKNTLETAAHQMQRPLSFHAYDVPTQGKNRYRNVPAAGKNRYRNSLFRQLLGKVPERSVSSWKWYRNGRSSGVPAPELDPCCILA